MRARKKKWAAGEFSISENLIREPERNKGAWSAYFGNANPLHVELGCGKGRFLTESAASNPSVNYIGVERESQVAITGMRHARELGLRNISFILADAETLPELFAACEIKRLYIQFCDPWPNRKKWAKRRLTHERYLDIYRPLLDGRIMFKTDNKELFEFTLTQFESRGWTVENVSYDLYKDGIADTSALMTEYEEKFYLSGQPIMRCEAYK